jgi:two-component system chemotaxis response regulator CheB
MKKIRVLVVDDSALMRKMISQILGADQEIEVVGTAMDGIFALKKMMDLDPDVITLDISMPRMDGIETLRHIVEDVGIPTVIVSSLSKKGAELTLRALEIGAFDFVTKPEEAISVHISEIGRELIAKVKAAYKNPLARFRIKKVRPVEVLKVKKPPRLQPPAINNSAKRVLAIGTSTGGPNALSYLLPLLPGDFPLAVLIVQHMPAGFTEMFANRLNNLCALEVKEARDGDLVLPGRVLIAPGNRHLKIRSMPMGTITVLSDAPMVNGHRPSADVLFRSVAQEYKENALGLIMTGMGDDGAEGIGEIMNRDGFTIAQSEASCVVFGMPKAAIEKNYIQSIVPLEDMGDYLISFFAGKEKVYGTTSH